MPWHKFGWNTLPAVVKLGKCVFEAEIDVKNLVVDVCFMYFFSSKLSVNLFSRKQRALGKYLTT